MKLPRLDVARFMGFVSKSDDGCWMWTGCLSKHGYGTFSTGRHAEKMKAHRAAWEIFRGEIPAGAYVLHKCDVRACVNTEHLYIGNAKDNCRDMFDRGRAHKRHHEHNGNAKLTPTEVRSIRQDPRRVYLIAKDYGVAWSTVDAIKRGQSWKSHTQETRP